MARTKKWGPCVIGAIVGMLLVFAQADDLEVLAVLAVVLLCAAYYGYDKGWFYPELSRDFDVRKQQIERPVMSCAAAMLATALLLSLLIALI